MTLLNKGRRQSKKSLRRILLVAPQPFYQDRGTPIAARYVVTALSEFGCCVDILTYPLGQDLDLPGVRTFKVGGWLHFKSIPIGLSVKKLLLGIIMTGAIWNRLRRDEYACIHAIEEAVYPALLLGRMKQIPVIYDMQSSLAEELGTMRLLRFPLTKKFLEWCERKACKNSRVIVCSLGLGKKIREESVSAQVHEWMFPKQLSKLPKTDEHTIRKELGLLNSTRVIVYIGNFAHYQGISLLMTSIPLIIRSYPDVVFLMAGADESSMQSMSMRHADLIKQGHLVLLTRQPRSRTIDLLEIAELGVSPRLRGANLPLKVFDYLAAGLPVVATDIDAHRPLRGKGLLLASPTPEGFAEALTSLLENPLLAHKYSETARCCAEKELSWPAFRERVLRIYGEVIPANLASVASKSG